MPIAAPAACSSRCWPRPGSSACRGPTATRSSRAAAEFAAMADAEPGTFWLTDFLARNFERLVIRGLGIDRHPELLATYFANYTRVVFLSQTDDPDLLALAERAAARLGLAFEHRPTSVANLAAPILASPPGRRGSVGPARPRGASADAQPHRDLVARHPRPGPRPRGPPGEQGPAPPAVPGRDRQGRQPSRQADLQRVHRGVAEGRPSLRRRPRGARSTPRSSASRPSTTGTASPS